MTDAEFQEFHEKKWAELPDDVKTKAVTFLRSQFSEELKEDVRARIKADPIHWIGMEHFGWGMGVRNALRVEGNIKDDLLPSGNWDDYYIKAVEAAVA